MSAFGVLDVREAFHQSDENQTGLVTLAGRRDAEGAAPGATMAA
jgi:hypothetical protein